MGALFHDSVRLIRLPIMPFTMQNVTGNNQINDVAGNLYQHGNTFYNDSRNSYINTGSTSGPKTRMYKAFLSICWLSSYKFDREPHYHLFWDAE